ncbi:MAG: transmembrane 220 family protein [Acidiferrobacterales bacterium]
MIAIRAINVVLTVLFLLSMAVQFNDPDPLLWMAIYGAVALIAALAVFSKFYVPLILIVLVICLGGSLYLMPSVFELLLNHNPGELFGTMSPDRPYVEESRESLGLLIAVVALVYFLILARKLRSAHT